MPNRFVDAVQLLLDEEKVPPEVAARLRGKLAALIAKELRQRGGMIQPVLGLLADRLSQVRREVDRLFFNDEH